MSKTIYHFSPLTGEYLGDGLALRDPVESKYFLMPADSTDQAPPESGEHQAAVFDREGQEWSLVDDWRGYEYWTEDGQQHRIDTLNQAPPAGALDAPPPPPPEQVAESKRSRRNGLLRASDWTQLPDSPLSQAQRDAYRAHRQALRDITDDPAWPDVTLPEPPAL